MFFQRLGMSALDCARRNLAAAVAKLDGRRVKRSRRLPPQLPPTAIEAAYAAGLVRLVGRAQRACAEPLAEALDLVDQARAARGDGTRYDAGGTTRRIRELMNAAKRKMVDAIDPREVRALAERHGRAAQAHNRAQLGRQLRAGMGADPTFRDPTLPEVMTQWAHRNVGLVTSIPQRLHGQLEGLVMDAVARSTPNARLGEDIAERFAIEKRHARLIARDQVSKLVGKINHHRQRELGIKSAIWRTVGDERVRESHADMEGEQFDYDDPPDVDGEPTLPSEAVCCRCYSEPVIGGDDHDSGGDGG